MDRKTFGAVPAHIRSTGGAPTERLQLPAGVDLTRIFVFEAEISNTRVDSYYTHMDRSTLLNFARAGGVGVALLDSHTSSILPIGYSYDARYEERADGDGATIASFYTLRGLQFGGRHSYATSDDIIAAIEGGLVRDVSVGFHGGDWTCDICHLDYFGMFSGREQYCTHYAGMTYEVTGDDGVSRQRLATVKISGADLSEVSIVYDGATPGAMITKAERAAMAGLLGDREAVAIEQRFNIRLPDRAKKGAIDMKIERVGEVDVEDAVVTTSAASTANVVIVADTAEVPEIANEDSTVVLTAEFAVDPDMVAVRAALSASGFDGQETVDAVQALIKERAQLASRLADADRLLAESKSEADRLRALADLGNQYRSDLVDQALAAGVRAQGGAFPAEQYRALLATADIDAIKAVISGFENVASERFPVGRQSVAEVGAKQNGRAEIPSAAFRG